MSQRRRDREERGARWRRDGKPLRLPEAPDPDDLGRLSEPPAVGRVLGAFTSRHGWQQRLREARIHEVWEEIAGPSMAQHVVPVRLHGGVLVVRVSSAGWASQLPYLVPGVIARADEILGEGQVTRVTVQTERGGSGRRGRNPSDRSEG